MDIKNFFFFHCINSVYYSIVKKIEIFTCKVYELTIKKIFYELHKMYIYTENTGRYEFIRITSILSHGKIKQRFI